MTRKSSWENAFVYQVYPWTFSEDQLREQQGHGSIRGITEQVPYLTDLGIDAVWISPFYPSPMKDGGYDIKDYTNINDALGTIKDFEELLDACHAVGIKLMIDFVPNHTSDQHEWFKKSAAHQDDYDDWYIWHPGTRDESGDIQPPNNWGSVFSIPMKRTRERGEMPELREDEWTPYISAWRWHEERQQYYLAEFTTEQPTLNWSNPKVREALLDVERFWFDKGVDGLRIDVLNHLGKNMELPDEAINTAYNEAGFDNPFDQLRKDVSSNHFPELEKYTAQIAQVAREQKYEGRDIRMIFESYSEIDILHRIDRIAADVGTTFNFALIHHPWEQVAVRKLIMDAYYANLPLDAVANQVSGNHDNSRLATRLGDAAARSAVLLYLFQPGMKFIYNGEELGLHDAVIPSSRVQDPNGLRDPYRTPMLFDDTLPNSGFSQVDPKDLYLPLNDKDVQLGLAANKQRLNPKSTHSLYKAAIRLNKTLPVLSSKQYLPCDTDNDRVLAYGRQADTDQAIIVVNFSAKEQYATVSGGNFALAKKVLSSIDVETFGDQSQELNLEDGVRLRPNEAVLIVPNHDRETMWE